MSLRRDTVSVTADGSTPLSARENQIMGLAASGLLDKQIGAELSISENTLRTYWRRIRDKLGEGSRASLVASYILREQGNLAVIETSAETTPPTNSAFYFATELRRTQEAMRQAKRALGVLRAYLNETAPILLEPDLLKAACRILVENGGYRIAWIGVPVYDEAKSVQILAHHGDTTEYIPTLKVSWGDGVYGHGPAGRSLRSGKSEVNRDCGADPMLVPWQEGLQRAGVQSCLALPLVHREAVIGVVVVYAPEDDAFDSQEVSLLEELVSNLSRKVGSLRDGPLISGAPASWELDVRERVFRIFDPAICATLGVGVGHAFPWSEVVARYSVLDRQRLESMLSKIMLGQVPSFGLKVPLLHDRGLGLSTAYVDVISDGGGAPVLLRGRRIPLLDLGQDFFGDAVCGVVSLDMATNTIQADPGARAIFGLPATGPVYATALQARFHPEDAEVNLVVHEQMIRMKVPRMVRSARIIGPDGNYHYISIVMNLTFEGDEPTRIDYTVLVSA